MAAFQEADLPLFFVDENVRFPVHPVLAPGLSIREVPHGLGIDFRGGPTRFMLRGREAVRVFSSLRPRLTGALTLVQILEDLPDTIGMRLALDCLKLLHQHGVLVESSGGGHWLSEDKDSSVATMASRLTREFWDSKLTITRSAGSTQELFTRNQSANLVVIVGGLVGYLTVELFGRLGLAAQYFPIDDFPLPDGCVAAAPPPKDDEADELERFVREIRSAAVYADVLVACFHGSAPALSIALNDVCLEARTPLLIAQSSSDVAEIMFVEPFRSACLVCRNLRTSLVSEFALEDHLFSLEETSNGRWLPEVLPAGESLVSSMLVAAHIGGEVWRYRGGGAPPTFTNAMYLVDQVSGMARREAVMRVPRCPSCSRSPLTERLERNRE